MPSKFQSIKHRFVLAWQALRTGSLTVNADRQIPQISSDDVIEIKTFFPMDKYFVFGHARSGTTLLIRLIRLHPEVHGNYQAHFFTRPPLLSKMAASEEIGEWLSRRSNRWNRGQDLTPVALRAMSDYIMERDARKEGKFIVGDKSPNSLLNGKSVHEAHRIYPDAKLIFIVRDGRDVLISHRFHNFITVSHHLPQEDLKIRDDFTKDPAPFFSGEKSLFTKRSIRLLAQEWVKNVLETDRMGRDMYGEQYHSLRFEDLTAKPYETISRVWQFLDVDPAGLEALVASEMSQNRDAVWQKEVASDLVSPLEKGKSGSWQDLFTERDKRIFKEVAGELLVTWGYEQDLNW